MIYIDQIHSKLVYMGLAQACPNYPLGLQLNLACLTRLFICNPVTSLQFILQPYLDGAESTMVRLQGAKVPYLHSTFGCGPRWSGCWEGWNNAIM